MTTTTIDARGARHLAAGAPASRGGQFTGAPTPRTPRGARPCARQIVATKAK